MDIVEMNKFVHEVTKKNGLRGINVVINNRLKRANARFRFIVRGGVYFQPKCIEVAKNLINIENKDDLVKQILLHEVAHYMAHETCSKYMSQDPHGEIFKCICKDIGCTENGAATKINAMYMIKCEHCNKFVYASNHFDSTVRITMSGSGLITCGTCRSPHLSVLDVNDNVLYNALENIDLKEMG